MHAPSADAERGASELGDERSAPLRTCTLVRVERAESNGLGRGWIVSRLGELRGFRVGDLAVAVLAYAAVPRTSREVLAFFSHVDVNLVTATWAALHSGGFLEAACGQRALADELAAWRADGWRAASAYHFHTYGYPFERYDEVGASDEDARRMHAYAAEQPDRDRGKTYAGTSRIPLPKPHADLLPTSVVDLVTHRSTIRPLDADRLMTLLSLTACSTGESALPWPGAAPVIRKTSPSGGSRHPTEVYLLNCGVAGLPAGWSHVDSLSCELETLDSEPVTTRELATLFSSLVGHAAYDVEAVVVFTCVFARNRYRYREPRTFRTIHMDVGHLLTTAEIVASGLGIAAASLNSVDSRKFGPTLGLDPLTEAPIAGLLVGSHDSTATASR